MQGLSIIQGGLNLLQTMNTLAVLGAGVPEGFPKGYFADYNIIPCTEFPTPPIPSKTMMAAPVNWTVQVLAADNPTTPGWWRTQLISAGASSSVLTMAANADNISFLGTVYSPDNTRTLASYFDGVIMLPSIRIQQIPVPDLILFNQFTDSDDQYITMCGCVVMMVV